MPENNTFFQKLTSINFTVKNLSSNRKIRIFNYPLMPGQTRDLLAIPEISEADIRHSLLKGELANLLRNKVISIVSSSIDLTQYDQSQATFLNSAGALNGVNTASNPTIWSQTDWYIDPVNGVDTNNGSINAPLKTFSRLTSIIGLSPVLTNSSVSSLGIHWLNDQPNQTDLVSITGVFHNVPFTMDGVLIQVGSGTFSATTNINRSSNITCTGTTANVGVPSNYWTQYLYMLVHDTTNNTWFRIDKDLGTQKAQFTRPLIGTVDWLAGNQPGTINPGDSYTIYRCPKIYAGPIDLSFINGNNATSAALFNKLWFASNSSGDMGMQLFTRTLGYAVFQNCTFDGSVNMHSDVYEQTIALNCYFTSTATLNNVSMMAGGVISLNATNNTVLDGDAMVHGAPEIVGDVSFNLCYFDNATIDVPFYGLAVPSAGSIGISKFNSTWNTAALWGPFQLKIHPNGRIFYDTTAVGCLLNTGGITIDGLTTGAKITPGSPRVTTDGVTITPANIDDTTAGKMAGMVSSKPSSAGIYPFI